MLVRWVGTTCYTIVLMGLLVNCGMGPVTENRIVMPREDNGKLARDQDKKLQSTELNGSSAVKDNSNSDAPPPLQTKSMSNTTSAASNSPLGGSSTSPGSDPAVFMQSAQDLERLKLLMANPQFSGLVSQLVSSGTKTISPTQLSALLGGVGGFSNPGSNDLGAALGGIDLDKLLNGNFAGVLPQTTSQPTVTTPK